MSSRPTRVTVVSNSLSGDGGAHRSTLEVAEGLHARGVRIQLVHAHGGDLMERWSAICDDLVQVPSTLFSRSHLRSFATAALESRRRVRGFDPDWVYTHSVSQLPLALTYRRSVAIHIHNDPEGPSRFHQRLINSANHVFFVSQAMLEAWGTVYRLTVPQSVAYNGVVIPDRLRTDEERNAVRRSLGLPSGTLLGFLGRDSPEKRLDLVFEAAFQAEDGHSRRPLSLLIAGELSSATIARLADNPDWQVLALGYLDDPWSVMDCVDVVVMPSDREGHPRVALEALANGIPLVATMVGGLPEILQPFPDQLVHPDDPAALRRAIDLVTRQPPTPQELSNSVRRYSWENTIDEMLAHLRIG